MRGAGWVRGWEGGRDGGGGRGRDEARAKMGNQLVHYK